MAEIIKLRSASAYRVYARGDVGTLYLYGIIGDSFFADGITAKQVAEDLKKLGRLATLNVRINSEGGDVFQGKTIYSLLKANPARIVAHVDGLAASSASLVAMAAHEIKIADGSFMMIHNAWSRVIGNAADLREAAALLEQVDQTIVDTYAGRTRQTREQIAAWMAAETWFGAADAKQHGFADQIVENMKVAAMITDAAQFRNLPAGLRPRRDRVQSYLASIKGS
jgi:ATP-dependent protease ClpP protease subunit